MNLMHKPTLSDVREMMDELTVDDLALWKEFSLDFLREWADRIDWREVFKKMYFTEKCDLLKYGFRVQQFDQFCKNYNYKFFKEYLERYFD